MLRKIVGDRIEHIFSFLEPLLPDNKIIPNILTFTGLGINLIGAFLFFEGYMKIAGFVILFAGLFDILDGAVARVRNLATEIGAFTDSVVDRYSDFVIFGGVLAYFIRKGNLAYSIVVLFVISGAFLISYIRAKAELIIPKCDVGFMERPERIIVLALGSIFDVLGPALCFLAIFTHLTAFYRIYYTIKRYKKKISPDREDQ